MSNTVNIRKELKNLNVLENDMVYEATDYDDLVASGADEEKLHSVDVFQEYMLFELGMSCSFNSIRCSTIDVEYFHDILDEMPELAQFVEEGKAEYPAFEFLCMDVYFSLFFRTPVLLDENQIYRSVVINYKLLESFMNMYEYDTLRLSCKNDEFLCIQAMRTICEEFLSYIVDLIKNDINDSAGYISNLTDLMRVEENIRLCDKNDAYGLSQYTLEQSQLLAEYQSNMAKIADKFDLARGNVKITNNVDIIQGFDIDAALNQVMQLDSLIAAWGFNDIGNDITYTRISSLDKQRALDRIKNTKKLTQITDLLGRFRESAREAQAKKAKSNSEEIKSVTTGDDLQSVLPSEFAKLSNVNTKSTFYSDYSEKKLTQYEKQAQNNKEKGPMIVCVDTSGSMSGEPEMWSKALTIGVLEIAQMQGRDFACILYSNTAAAPIIIKKKENAPDKKMDICEKFMSGGTNWQRPLEKALSIIENSTVFENADILFITDGSCSIGKSFETTFANKKKQLGFKCKGVLIDNTTRSKASMELFCDDVVLMSDFAAFADPNNPANQQLFEEL